MNNKLIQNDSTYKEMSLIKIIIICLFLCIVMFLTIFYFSDQSSTKKANLAYSIAQDYIEKGDLDKAIEKLDEAISLRATSDYYYTKYLVLSSGQEKYNEAAFYIDKALESSSHNAYYYYEAANFYFNKVNDSEKGFEYLRKAISLDPKNSDYIADYAGTLTSFGKYDEAIKVYKELIDNDPNYYASWNDLASTYGYAGKVNKELEIRLQAVKRFPDDAYHWFWLANTYDKQNNKKKAVEAYQKSIKLDPESGAHAANRIAELTKTKIPENYREIIEDTAPVTYKNSHAYIKASFAGSEGSFLLDTGATDSFIYKKFVKKNSLSEGKNSPTTNYSTANGAISVPVLYSDVKIGKFKLSNVRVGILPDADENFSDGIIGMNIIKNFNMKMNNLNSSLILSRK